MGFRNPITSLRADEITPGTLPPGVILPPGQLADGSLPLGVLAQALANASVTSPAIAASAVLTPHLAAGVVEATKVALGVLQTNLLRNPGFEDTGEGMPTPGARASVPGWTIGNNGAGQTYGENFRYATEYSDGFEAISGRGYALLSHSGWAGEGSWLRSAPIAVQPGHKLRAAVSSRDLTGAVSSQVLIVVIWRSTDGGVTFPLADYAFSLPAGPTPTTTTVTMAAPIPAGTTHVRFEVRHRGNNTMTGGGAGYVAVDDAALFVLGTPAVELTPAGIRMWDEAGALSVQIDARAALISTQALDIGSYVTIGSGLEVFGTFDCNADAEFPLGLRAADVWGDRLYLLGPPTTTSGANVYRDFGTGQLYLVSSLAKYKLNREPIPALLELLDVAAVTWRDAGDVAGDPDTTRRVPGFVAEDVRAISAAHGGSLDPLLTWDADGNLQGLAYDRFVAYLLPIVAQLHERVKALEEAR